MNHHQDPAYAPTLTALPAYQEPPTDQFPAVPTGPAAPAPISDKKNGFGITTFILGLVGTVAGLVPLLYIPALACGLVGFGFGLGGIKRLRTGWADNKVMTILGVIFSVVAFALGCYGMYVVNKALGDLQTDLNNISATPAP